MKKLIGHALLVFAVFYASTVSANSPDGKSILCGSALGPRGYHFYGGEVLAFDDSMKNQPIYKKAFTETHDSIQCVYIVLTTLDRKTLKLTAGSHGRYQCKLLPLKEIKSRLADSKKRKLTGNKL